jgi:hypothetical protein
VAGRPHGNGSGSLSGEQAESSTSIAGWAGLEAAVAKGLNNENGSGAYVCPCACAYACLQVSTRRWEMNGRLLRFTALLEP